MAHRKPVILPLVFQKNSLDKELNYRQKFNVARHQPSQQHLHGMLQVTCVRDESHQDKSKTLSMALCITRYQSDRNRICESCATGALQDTRINGAWFVALRFEAHINIRTQEQRLREFLVSLCIFTCGATAEFLPNTRTMVSKCSSGCTRDSAKSLLRSHFRMFRNGRAKPHVRHSNNGILTTRVTLLMEGFALFLKIAVWKKSTGIQTSRKISTWTPQNVVVCNDPILNLKTNVTPNFILCICPIIWDSRLKITTKRMHAQ